MWKDTNVFVSAMFPVGVNAAGDMFSLLISRQKRHRGSSKQVPNFAEISQGDCKYNFTPHQQ